MVDYVSLAATALRLISKNGFTITVQKLTAAPSDPAMPWRGPTDPRAPVAATFNLKAVSIPLKKTLFGSMFSKKDIPDKVTDYFLAAPELTTPDLTDFDELIANGHTYRIVDLDVLRPAGTPMLYYFMVEK